MALLYELHEVLDAPELALLEDAALLALALPGREELPQGLAELVVELGVDLGLGRDVGARPGVARRLDVVEDQRHVLRVVEQRLGVPKVAAVLAVAPPNGRHELVLDAPTVEVHRGLGAEVERRRASPGGR
jgi:hypothetical protein